MRNVRPVRGYRVCCASQLRVKFRWTSRNYKSDYNSYKMNVPYSPMYESPLIFHRNLGRGDPQEIRLILAIGLKCDNGGNRLTVDKHIHCRQNSLWCTNYWLSLNALTDRFWLPGCYPSQISGHFCGSALIRLGFWDMRPPQYDIGHQCCIVIILVSRSNLIW